jgi:hypothetical protein
MLTLARISFWILVALCAVYCGQLVHALVVASLTEPAACRISTATLLPAPLCPGLDWSQHHRFLASLPGAYLSYPVEIGFRTSNPMLLLNAQFILVMGVHLLGWGYAVRGVFVWMRGKAAQS